VFIRLLADDLAEFLKQVWVVLLKHLDLFGKLFSNPTSNSGMLGSGLIAHTPFPL